MQDVCSCIGSYQCYLATVVGQDLLSVGREQEDGHHLGRTYPNGTVPYIEEHLRFGLGGNYSIGIVAEIFARDGLLEDINGNTVESVLDNRPLIIGSTIVPYFAGSKDALVLPEGIRTGR